MLLDKIDDPKIANYGLAQHFILTLLYNILGKESATNTWIHDSEEYIKNINFNNETMEKILNILITHFNFYMKEQKKDEFDYKNFFKSKEEVESLLAKMLTMFTTSLQLNGKEFEDILK